MKKILFFVMLLFLSIPATAQAKDNDTYISSEVVSVAEKYAEQYGICPEVIVAIIESESSGRQYAENGKCKGLMQINIVAQADRIERLGVTDIFDIDSNIHVGVDILYDLIQKCDEDIAFALSRYNGVKNARALYENGEFSKYARKILNRSEELEIIHEEKERRENARKNLFEKLRTAELDKNLKRTGAYLLNQIFKTKGE